MDKFCTALSREIAIEFNRTMGKIIFDRTVRSQPGAFPFVALPEPIKVVAKATGRLICAHTFKADCTAFTFWLFKKYHYVIATLM